MSISKNSEHDLAAMLNRVKKTQELLASNQGNKKVYDSFNINNRDIEICYSAETHGGGGYVLDSLGRELDLAEINPKKILECFCGPVFFGFYSLAKFTNAELVLTDINPKIASLVEETISKNDFQNVQLYIGNCLEKVPPEPFDLVLANPPWWSEETAHLKKMVEILDPNIRDILFLDKDFNSHKLFFKDLQKFIHDQSVIYLLEGEKMGEALVPLAEAYGFSATTKRVDFLESHDEIPKESLPIWIILKKNPSFNVAF